MPLLRAPPFPQAAGAAAAVSSSVAAPRALQIDSARVERLCDLVAAARVGGSFWGPRPGLPSRSFRVSDAPEVDGLRLHTGEDPWPAILAAEEIVAAPGSEIGLLALIAGRDVRLPGGSRWGDRLETAHRALVTSVAYRDPFSGLPADAERVIDLLALWRGWLDANRQIGSVRGVAAWKRRALGAFLWDGSGSPVENERAAGARAVWPSREEPDAGDWQIEDGFLRSAGLGAELREPFSIAVDRRGIYYDPSRPSDLEHKLQHGAFSEALTERARKLRSGIVGAQLAKYGVRGEPFSLPRGRRLILVPGQVEDDRSVQLGGGRICSNAELLRAVRLAEPDAHIVFKPHPDIEAGLRAGGPSPALADRLADTVARGASLPSLFAQVDEVHTLTSLTGFEALMREIPVTTYGAPFYAGWGLTRDRGQVPARRTARRSLDELVAAALILYPRYLDPQTRLPCPPEVLVSRLAGAAHAESPLTRARRLQGRMAKLWRKAG